MQQEIITKITKRLKYTFSPQDLRVSDRSYLHKGHPGAQKGKAHIFVMIKSDLFKNKSLKERHQLIYEALADFMETDIHALEIKATD